MTTPLIGQAQVTATTRNYRASARIPTPPGIDTGLPAGPEGPPGPPGPPGPQGPAGTGLEGILGELPNASMLPLHGEPGQAWIVGGDLYVWKGPPA
jgi:hypothetical protein